MVRDIVFLSLLILAGLIGGMLFLRIKKLLGVVKRTQQSTKELGSKVRERGSGRTAAVGAGLAFFSTVMVVFFIRRVVNWVREEVLEEE